MGELVRLHERAPKLKQRQWWQDVVDDFDVWRNDLVAHYGGVVWDVDAKALISASISTGADIHPPEKVGGVWLPPMCKIGLVRSVFVPPQWRKEKLEGAERAPLRFGAYVPLLKDVSLPWHCPDELRKF